LAGLATYGQLVMTSMTYTGSADHSQDRTEHYFYGTNVNGVDTNIQRQADGTLQKTETYFEYISDTAASYTETYQYCDLSGLETYGQLVMTSMGHTGSVDHSQDRSETYYYGTDGISGHTEGNRQADGSLQKTKTTFAYSVDTANSYSELYQYCDDSQLAAYGQLVIAQMTHTGTVDHSQDRTETYY
jgi:hypothetical protein